MDPKTNSTRRFCKKRNASLLEFLFRNFFETFLSLFPVFFTSAEDASLLPLPMHWCVLKKARISSRNRIKSSWRSNLAKLMCFTSLIGGRLSYCVVNSHISFPLVCPWYLYLCSACTAGGFKGNCGQILDKRELMGSFCLNMVI